MQPNLTPNMIAVRRAPLYDRTREMEETGLNMIG